MDFIKALQERTTECERRRGNGSLVGEDTLSALCRISITCRPILDGSYLLTSEDFEKELKIAYPDMKCSAHRIERILIKYSVGVSSNPYFDKIFSGNKVQFGLLEDDDGSIGKLAIARCKISKAFVLAKLTCDIGRFVSSTASLALKENKVLLDFYLTRLNQLIDFKDESSPISYAHLYLKLMEWKKDSDPYNWSIYDKLLTILKSEQEFMRYIK